MIYIILISLVFIFAGCVNAKPVDIHTWRKAQYRKRKNLKKPIKN